MVDKLRRVGSNVTESFWCYGEPEEDTEPANANWVKIKDIDTGISCYVIVMKEGRCKSK